MHPSLPSFTSVLPERPAFDQQRSKLDNEHDDENENDSGSEAGKEMQARIVAMLTRLIARFDRDEPPIRKD